MQQGYWTISVENREPDSESEIQFYATSRAVRRDLQPITLDVFKSSSVVHYSGMDTL